MPRSYGTTNAAPSASAPAVGLAGDTYYNSTNKVLYLSDGSVWNPAVPNGVPAGGTQDQVLQKNSATDYDDSWTSIIGANGGVSQVVASGNNTFGQIDGRRINGTGAMGALQTAFNFRGLGYDGVSTYRTLGSIGIGAEQGTTPTVAGGTLTFNTTAANTLTNTTRLRMDSNGLTEIPGKVKIGQATLTAGLTGSILDLSNGLLNIRRQAITLVNGANDNLTLPTSSFVEFTGPTAAFTLTGIAGGTDGAVIEWVYLGSQPFTVAWEGATSTAANRITTVSTATGGEYMVGPCAGTLIYNASTSRWLLTNVRYGGYLPNRTLYKQIHSTNQSGITTTESTLYTTPSITFPANRKISLVAHFYCTFLNNGCYFRYVVDGALPNSGLDQIARVDQTSAAQILHGECTYTPTAGAHTFGLVTGALSGTYNIRGDQVWGYFEVRDMGAT